MAGRDFHNTVKYQAVGGKIVGATAVATSVYVDRSGYGSLEFVLSKLGSTASTTHTMTLLVATATSGGATVAADTHVLGSDAVTASGKTITSSKVGYIGDKRYVAVKYNSTVATGAYMITAVLGSPIKQPES